MCKKCNKPQCSCEHEAISSVGKKGDRGMKGASGDSLPAWWFRALLVDFLHGDDAKAVKYSNTIPYKTFAAARLAASAGDTIVFLPGTHNIYTGLLAMNSVSIYAMPGSTINVNNDQTATSSEGLAILGEGVWVFNDTGISLDGEHSNTDTYTFNFRELYIRKNFALRIYYGNVSVKGGSVFIEDLATTFLSFDGWEGARVFVEIVNLFDYSDYSLGKDDMPNIFVVSLSSGANFFFTFEKIFTYNSRFMIAANDSNEFNCTIKGDVDQSLQLAGTSPNCTFYLTGNGANYNLYGNYKTTCPQCLIVVSNTTNSIATKVYHEGSIFSVQAYGCVIVAGVLAFFKQKGIYIGGIVESITSESAIIKVGLYDDFNFFLPEDGITSGGNVEINGTIINKQDLDSNEIFAVYDLGDTADVSILRVVNSKFIFPNTSAQASIRAEQNQSLEVIGALGTNAVSDKINYTQVGTGVIDLADYTDDEIL